MVVSVIVQFLIVIFISTLLYGVTLWAVRCPNIISGFRWGNTPEEVEQDRQWLRRFYRVMTRTALVILVGGVVSIALKSMLLYVLFLCVPAFVAPLYLALLSPRRKVVTPGCKAIYWGIIVSIVLLLVVPAVHFYYKDLEVVFASDDLEIKGLYGQTIRYDDILRIEECPALPEISYRANGLSLDATNLGYFKTRDGETIKLFTHSDSCYIEIEDRRHNRFYLSKKREEETNELYDAILSRLSER